ncbi:MAG: hypothetical protein GXY83_10430 [Rhodopirellula sp.]|nr:hypothetical protein [Rhodopirellula sp.]
MASPFRVFRKHQKAMLVVLGLMAMIAFVFLPILMDQMQTRSYADPVVVTTESYGDVTRSEIGTMLSRRQALLGFLYQVQAAVQQAGGQGTEAMRLSRQIGEATEENVVHSWLLTRKADDLGLAVDDTAINAVLNSLTEQRVPTERIQQILGNSRMSQATLFDVLNRELLALRLQDLFGVSLVGTTPAQAWDYFQRVNRKATVEVAAIPVARFTNGVSDPEEATLREFFDKYKEDLPNPASPEPGFRVPRRIAVEYVKADYEKVLQTVEVSDDDIRKYYEEHKENYKREELPSLEPKAEEAAAPKPSASEDASNSQPDEEPKKEEKSDAAPPTNDDSSSSNRVSPFALVSYSEENADSGDKPQSEDKPEDKPEEEPAEKPAAKDTPTERKETPAKPDPAEAAAEKPEPKADMKETPAKPKETPAKPEPAKAAAEKPEPKADMKEAPAKPKETPTKAEPAKAAAEKPEPKADVKETPAKPKETPAKPEPAMAAEKPAAKTPAVSAEKPEEKLVEKPAETPKKPAYTPLEEVREEIRRQLQRERAQAKVQELIQRIQEKMAVYYNQWIVYGASAQQDAESAKSPPAQPNLAELVAGTPLTTHSSPLVSAVEAGKLDISDSWSGSDPFANFAYAGNLPKFKPATSQDNDGNTYLFWKTDEAEEREPEFNDPQVRQRVLREWKLVQARDTAVKEANRLADEARTSDKTFKEFFTAKPDTTVTEAGPFSWLTYGNIPPMYWLQSQQPPQISDVAGVDSPGSDFMQTVFGLEAGKIGVAMNLPKTEVYVVRPIEFNPLPDVLWTLFLEDRLSRFMAVSADRRGLWSGWLEGIKESAGFEWKEKPEKQQRRAS